MTSSIAGIGAQGSTMAYSVSKAAGLQLMKCLAITQGPKVRVNAVLPGLLLTEWVSLPMIYPGGVCTLTDIKGSKFLARANPGRQRQSHIEERGETNRSFWEGRSTDHGEDWPRGLRRFVHRAS